LSVATIGAGAAANLNNAVKTCWGVHAEDLFARDQTGKAYIHTNVFSINVWASLSSHVYSVEGCARISQPGFEGHARLHAAPGHGSMPYRNMGSKAGHGSMPYHTMDLQVVNAGSCRIAAWHSVRGSVPYRNMDSKSYCRSMPCHAMDLKAVHGSMPYRTIDLQTGDGSMPYRAMDLKAVNGPMPYRNMDFKAHAGQCHIAPWI
jgi:hypothetical protein